MPNINKILAADQRACHRGAPLGDPGFNESASPLHLQQVRLDSGGYGPDATYWGLGGDRLYCAFNGDDERFAPAMGTRLYVRAANRKEARQCVASISPRSTFRM